MERTSIGRAAFRRLLWLLPVLLHVHAVVVLNSDRTALRVSGHGSANATQGVESGSAPDAPKVVPFPVPEVRHRKTAGEGYGKNSPLYARQEARTAVQELESTEAVKADQSAERSTKVVTEANVEAMPKARISRGPAKAVSTPPVSTTMECVINLTGQFFFVYTAWFVVQALNRLKVIEREREERCLVAVVETVFFVPMLCVLFLAARLRALQLTQGQTEQYKLPQWWVKAGMIICTWSVLLQTLLVFACTTSHGELWEAVVRKQGLGQTGRWMMSLRNVIMFCIYAGFTLVCIGTCMMQPPAAIWGKGGPPVSPAVLCTIVLTVAYFAVYLALACARLTNEIGLMGQTLRFSQAQELLISATTTVAFAPMLCVIFMAARIQALQFDFKDGNPATWVQMCFYACTFSIILQAGLAVCSACIGVRERDDSRDFIRGPPRSSQRLSPNVAWIDIARHACIAVVHLSVGAIVVGMLMAQPHGNGVVQKTMPTPLKCVIQLTALYFAVHLALFIVRYLQRTRPAPQGVQQSDNLSAIEVFLGVRAKEAVAFCPMFCILFLSCMMRQLQISGDTVFKDGARDVLPEWCQRLTVVAAWSIVLLTMARFDVLLPRATRFVTTVCTATQYICLLLLYLSAILIVMALFTMTTEAEQGVPVKLL